MIDETSPCSPRAAPSQDGAARGVLECPMSVYEYEAHVAAHLTSPLGQAIQSLTDAAAKVRAVGLSRSEQSIVLKSLEMARLALALHAARVQAPFPVSLTEGALHGDD